MNLNLSLIWESQVLDSSRPFITTVVDVDFVLNCLIATNSITGQRLLLIETPSNGLDIIADQRFRGVEIQTLDIREVAYAAIILIDNRFTGIFDHFVNDILTEISQALSAKEGLSRAAGAIAAWKRMFESSGNNCLSAEAQKGLFGELYLLRTLTYVDQFTRVLDAWQGPDRANQDFMFPALSIEVKTTSVNHPSLQITNEHQLRRQVDTELFLYLLIVDIQPGKTDTLVSLISQIRELLSLNPIVLGGFNQKLITAGCLDTDFEHYENTRYIPREELVYQVTNDFPVLSPETLPYGIYQTSYKIELSAVLPFVVPYVQLYNCIKLL